MDSGVPFHTATWTGEERAAVDAALCGGVLRCDGPFSLRVQELLEARLDSPHVLPVHSGTAALEIAALLCGVGPGDEVIVPSFTFCTTASAFALRGAVPVFVDIRPDTWNLDETLVAAALTGRTRAIVPVHYAGVACEMDTLRALADRHGCALIEDAAQAIGACYRQRPLGSLGRFGCFSFHETKNIQCGEGGAVAVNRPEDGLAAEIVREKGTNRTQFVRGEVDRYTWCALGSSYGMAEVNAAMLYAQLRRVDSLTDERRTLHARYAEALRDFAGDGFIRLQASPEECRHNGHTFGFLLPDAASRDAFLAAMRRRGVQCAFHYVPLHSAPAGLRCGRIGSGMETTDAVASRLVRLPLWNGLGPLQERVVDAARATLAELQAERRRLVVRLSR